MPGKHFVLKIALVLLALLVLLNLVVYLPPSNTRWNKPWPLQKLLILLRHLA